MNRVPRCLILSCLLLTALGARAQTCTIHNPTRREMVDELVRLEADAPPMRFAVLCDGNEVPHQVEQVGERKIVWVCTSMPAESTKR